MAEKKKDIRTRVFASVVYPDSETLPVNWRDILSDEHVPAFISPLHDNDVNATGEPKKPHYHVLIMYEGLKTIEQAKEFIARFGGVGCEKVASTRAYARYLCHLDNPEKAQYNVDDVVQLSGADYPATIQSSSDKYAAFREMVDFCLDNNIISYSQLVLYAREYRSDWFRILCDCGTVFMSSFLRSVEWSTKDENISALSSVGRSIRNLFKFNK